MSDLQPRAAPSHSLMRVAAVIVLAIGLAVLASGLPPDTFVAGDSGVKLLAVRHAVQHPARPLELPQPTIGGEPVRFVEPFFVAHADHLDAVTSEAFVLASAPFYAWFGLRGVYVLPAIGFLMSVIGWTWIGRILSADRSAAWLAAVAVLGTPWLFYGLEFWGHAPALGLSAVGAALVLSSCQTPCAPSWWGSVPRAAVGGLLLGVAVAFRLETSCFIAGWLAVLTGFPGPTGLTGLPTRGRLRTPLVASAIGLAIPLSAIVAANLIHRGQIWDTHIAANAGLFATDFGRSRLELINAWFVTMNDGNAWRVAPVLLLGVAAPLVVPMSQGGRRALLVTAAVTMALVIATAPNDGGGHWGPRYLLLAYGPLVILTADVLQSFGTRHIAGAALAIVVLGGGAWIQRTSYKKLVATKRIYGRVLAFVREETAGADAVVTDLWWLDQVTAAASTDRPILFAATPDEASALFRKFHAAALDRIVAIESRSESSGAVAATGAGCYTVAGRREIPERDLVAVRLARRSCE